MRSVDPASAGILLLRDPSIANTFKRTQTANLFTGPRAQLWRVASDVQWLLNSAPHTPIRRSKGFSFPSLLELVWLLAIVTRRVQETVLPHILRQVHRRARPCRLIGTYMCTSLSCHGASNSCGRICESFLAFGLRDFLFIFVVSSIPTT